jgi:methionine synthase II (cobalamin-independent)
VIPALHSCAAGVPVALLHRAGVRQLYLDLALLDEAQWEEVGERLEQGLVLGAGAWPPGGSRTVSEVVEQVAAPLRRLGLRLVERSDTSGLHAEQIIVTPSCGLAGTRPADAVTALRTVRQAADRLVDRLAG